MALTRYGRAAWGRGGPDGGRVRAQIKYKPNGEHVTGGQWQPTVTHTGPERDQAKYTVMCRDIRGRLNESLDKCLQRYRSEKGWGYLDSCMKIGECAKCRQQDWIMHIINRDRTSGRRSF